MIQTITAKSILSTVKIHEGSDNPFGIRYNMNLYRGCQHGCIYCDSRSSCYRIENFSDILVKENAIELLEKELGSKKVKGTIGTGSMNDPYMPLEQEVGLTRRALQVVNRFGYPVHIITKSDLVVRDLDVIQDIGRVYAAVSLTITTPDDNLAGLLEPHAPNSTSRLAALSRLSEAGIYAGVVISPVLPYLTDDQKALETLICRAKDAGAKYIISWLGMTNREGQREYFYAQLDQKFPGVKGKYQKTYGNVYSCAVPNYQSLKPFYESLCCSLSLPTKMDCYNETPNIQLALFE